MAEIAIKHQPLGLFIPVFFSTMFFCYKDPESLKITPFGAVGGSVCLMCSISSLSFAEPGLTRPCASWQPNTKQICRLGMVSATCWSSKSADAPAFLLVCKAVKGRTSACWNTRLQLKTGRPLGMRGKQGCPSVPRQGCQGCLRCPVKDAKDAFGAQSRMPRIPLVFSQGCQGCLRCPVKDAPQCPSNLTFKPCGVAAFVRAGASDRPLAFAGDVWPGAWDGFWNGPLLHANHGLCVPPSNDAGASLTWGTCPTPEPASQLALSGQGHRALKEALKKGPTAECLSEFHNVVPVLSD
eukprot:1158633-Pelagomonas_calceolata.AAC.2